MPTREEIVDYVRENKPIVIGSLVVVAIALILVGFVAAIAGGESTPPPDAPPQVELPPGETPPTDPTAPPPDQVTINWWGGFLSPGDVAPVIERYEANNPNVKINYSNEIIRNSDIPGYQNRLDDIIGDETVANRPDIYIVDAGWSRKYRRGSLPADSELISAAQVRSEFHNFVATDFVLNDQVYGLPLWVDNLALIYNRDLWAEAGFSEPETDWLRFADQQVPELTQMDDGQIEVSGFAAGVETNSEFWFEALQLFMAQNRVELGTNAVTITENPDSTSSVDFYRSFAGNRNAWNGSFNQDVGAFLEGRLATYLAPSWRLNDIVRYNDNYNLGLNIGVAEVPQLQSETEARANVSSYWGMMVNSATIYPEQTWDFLNYLASAEGLELLHQGHRQARPGELPMLYPRRDLAQTQANNNLLAPYANSLQYTVSWSMGDKSRMKAIFSEVFTGTRLTSLTVRVQGVLDVE